MTPSRGSMTHPSRMVTLFLALVAGFVAGLATHPAGAATGDRDAVFATAHIADPFGTAAGTAAAPTAGTPGAGPADRGTGPADGTTAPAGADAEVTAQSRRPAQCDDVPHPARDGTQAAVTGTPHADPLPHPAATRVAVPAGRTAHPAPPRAPPLPPTGCAELLPVLRI
ncbi:hypothetical protein ACQUSR_21570 [Streptomyces sp. P1-3]|uniref:hypothetical protein n=1 Tax=Streptomyces sp. P1-3 TaxID=3421658 RepID=UPI003D368E06